MRYQVLQNAKSLGNALSQAGRLLPEKLVEIDGVWFVLWRSAPPRPQRGLYEPYIRNNACASSNGIRYVTPFKVLLDLPHIPPFDAVACHADGIIFHTSRCGSTLFGNVLATDDRTFVVQEAHILGIFWLQLRMFSRFDEMMLASAYKAIICALRVAFEAEYAKMYIKTSSVEIFAAQELLQFVKGPALLLFRNPAEVLVSLNRNANSFLSKQHLPWLARILGFETHTEFPSNKPLINIVYVNRVFDKATQLAITDLARPVGYETLMAGKETIVCELLRWLDQGHSLVMARILRELGKYSKGDAMQEIMVDYTQNNNLQSQYVEIEYALNRFLDLKVLEEKYHEHSRRPATT